MKICASSYSAPREGGIQGHFFLLSLHLQTFVNKICVLCPLSNAHSVDVLFLCQRTLGRIRQDECLGLGGPLFQFPARLFWKAPTSSSHQKFILGHLLTLGLRCGGSTSALLSAPFQGPNVSVSCKEDFFWKGPTSSSHQKSFAHTMPKIWSLEKCSTIRPLLGAHYLSFLQVRIFWQAPTSSSHQKFILGHLLSPTQTSRGSKSALLSAPF